MQISTLYTFLFIVISVHSLPSAQDSDGIVVPTIPTDGIVVPTIPSDGDTSTSGADVPQDSGDPRDRGDQRTADGANTSERGQRVSAEPNSGEDTRTNRLKAVEFSQSGARRGDSDQGSPAPTVDNSKLGLACEVYGQPGHYKPITDCSTMSGVDEYPHDEYPSSPNLQCCADKLTPCKVPDGKKEKDLDYVALGCINKYKGAACTAVHGTFTPNLCPGPTVVQCCTRSKSLKESSSSET